MRVAHAPAGKTVKGKVGGRFGRWSGFDSPGSGSRSGSGHGMSDAARQAPAVPPPPVGLYRYVAAGSLPHQLGLTVLVALSAGLALVPIEMQRRLVNEGIGTIASRSSRATAWRPHRAGPARLRRPGGGGGAHRVLWPGVLGATRVRLHTDRRERLPRHAESLDLALLAFHPIELLTVRADPRGCE
jgi:hypothetical protein